MCLFIRLLIDKTQLAVSTEADRARIDKLLEQTQELASMAADHDRRFGRLEANIRDLRGSVQQPKPQQLEIVQLTPPPNSHDPPGIPKSRIKPPPQEPNCSEPAIKAHIVSRSNKVNTVGTRSFPNSTLISGIIDVGRPVTIIGQFRDEVKICDEDGRVSFISKDNVEPQE